MHIPDGYLGPTTYGGLWAVMIGVWSIASSKVKRDLKASQVPYLALGAAFSFVAMIFALPLPGGTTAHITGAALIAVLIGPWAAVIAVSTALVIQALIFGDGGVTAIAANCFNIAFAGSLCGWAAYRLVAAVGGKVVGAAVGAYVGVNAAAFCTAVELGIQPLIHGAGGGYFPYSPRVALAAIMIPHLTVVGGLEALVAGLVAAFMAKTQPGIPRDSKAGAVVVTVVAAALLLQASNALAHDFVIERKGLDFAVVFGHGTHLEDFEASKVKSLRAFDAGGSELPVQKEKADKALVVKIAGSPGGPVTADVDNGYWSKTIYGWKELPKRKASRVVEAVRSRHYPKTLLAWNDAVRNVTSGAGLDVSPQKDPFALKPGDSLELKVSLNGKPLPGAEIEGGDHKVIGKTGPDGTLSVKLAQGQNIFAVDHKEPLRDDPDADALSLTATLAFEVKN